MIQLPLLLSNKRSLESPDVQYGNYRKNHFNFIYGNKALLLLTVGFLAYKLVVFLSLQHRPEELFIPDNYFGKLLMPRLPDSEVYISILVIAGFIAVYLLFKPQPIWLRLVLVLQLAWLHVAQWSYGFFSHVGHLFLLAHLFSVFIPFIISKEKTEAKIINRTLNWYYAGLLLTYILSGIWKWLGLFYKLVFKPTDINWLHPDASLFNAVISFHNYDLPFTSLSLFSYPLLWQTGFLLILGIQTFCLSAAFYPALRTGISVALIIFHVVNALVFATVFILAPIVIACLFLPYYSITHKLTVKTR